MSGTVFGSRIRSSVSTFAFAALMAAAPVLSAGAATVVPAAPAASTPAATTDSTTPAPTTKVEQKAVTKSEATKTEATKTEAGKTEASKTKHEQVAATPKAEVTKTQADAVAKELGAKPTDQLSVQLGKYHEQMLAAHALKDSAARDKAAAEARQQLAGIGGKPVTAEQAAKIDNILGVKTSTTIQ